MNEMKDLSVIFGDNSVRKAIKKPAGFAGLFAWHNHVV
jgi:hypothetical protein